MNSADNTSPSDPMRTSPQVLVAVMTEHANLLVLLICGSLRSVNGKCGFVSESIRCLSTSFLI